MKNPTQEQIESLIEAVEYLQLYGIQCANCCFNLLQSGQIPKEITASVKNSQMHFDAASKRVSGLIREWKGIGQ